MDVLVHLTGDFRAICAHPCAPRCVKMAFFEMEQENAAFGVHKANLPKTVLVLQFGPMI